MAILNFPSGAVDGQTSLQPNGVTYTYKDPPGVWTAPFGGTPPVPPGPVVPGMVANGYMYAMYDAASQAWAVWLAGPDASGNLQASGVLSLLMGKDGTEFFPVGPYGDYRPDGFGNTTGIIGNYGPSFGFYSGAEFIYVVYQTGYTTGRIVKISLADGSRTFTNTTQTPIIGQSGYLPLWALRSKSGFIKGLSQQQPYLPNLSGIYWYSTDDLVTVTGAGTWNGLGDTYPPDSYFYLPNIDRFFFFNQQTATNTLINYYSDGVTGTNTNITWPYSVWPGIAPSGLAENSTGSVLVAVVNNSTANPDYGEAYYSTNGGSTWTLGTQGTPAPTNDQIFSGVWFINGKFRILEVTRTTLQVKLFSSTDGATWTSQDVTANFPTYLPAYWYEPFGQSASDGVKLLITGYKPSWPPDSAMLDVPSSLFT